MPVFLFTDIEGSTELWEKHPQAMDEVLARHDAILQRIVAQFGGRVVKHTGDGLFAVFAAGAPLPWPGGGPVPGNRSFKTSPLL